MTAAYFAEELVPEIRPGFSPARSAGNGAERLHFRSQNEKAKSEIVPQIAASCAGPGWTTRAGATWPSRCGRSATCARPGRGASCPASWPPRTSAASTRSWVLLKENTFRTCYSALVEADEGFDLEVEIANGVIGATDFGIGRLETARRLAAELDKHLTAKGITVFKDREEWQASWGDENAPPITGSEREPAATKIGVQVAGGEPCQTLPPLA